MPATLVTVPAVLVWLMLAGVLTSKQASVLSAILASPVTFCEAAATAGTVAPPVLCHGLEAGSPDPHACAAMLGSCATVLVTSTLMVQVTGVTPAAPTLAPVTVMMFGAVVATAARPLGQVVAKLGVAAKVMLAGKVSVK